MSVPHLHTPGLLKPRWQQRIDQARSALAQIERMPGLALAPPSTRTIGDYVSLCLPVEFPDVPATVTQKEIDAFCNRKGYDGFGNHGSVADYFLDNSLGKLRVRTIVAPYYKAQHPRSHYTDRQVEYSQRAKDLLREALEFHRAQGRIDFSPLTTDARKAVRATNVFYAGNADNAHGEGLWPHASRMDPAFDLGDGRVIADYQISALGDGLTLGTYCHENGHMLCDFPDLYEYSSTRRAGCGSFCLMCFGAVADEHNPTQVGAYLKYKSGWARPTVLEAGKRYTATADGSSMFIHPRSETEYLLIEYRARQLRDAALPGAGLAIWHIDEMGSNAEPKLAAEGHRHYECRLLQADRRDDLAAGSGPGTEGDESDLFPAGSGPVFAPAHLPRWWSGSGAGLQLRDLREVDGGMEFTFG